MPLSMEEWQSIDGRINSFLAKAVTPQFTQGKVIKADPVNNLVWLREFGNQPIPVFSFDFEVKYYDTQADGTVSVKKAKVRPLCPKKGDIVLVARQFGSRYFPKCIGVLRSENFVIQVSS